MRTPISCRAQTSGGRRAQTSGGRRAQTGNSTIIGRLEMCALSPPAAAEDRDIIVTADNCLLFDDDDWDSSSMESFRVQERHGLYLADTRSK